MMSMTSRRAFLHASLTGGALLALSPLARLSDASDPDRIYKAVFDERFPAALAFAHDLRQRGVATHGIRGDVTALWYHDLHFAWANAPIRLVGSTTASALFCLEMLARDAGHRVTRRRALDRDLVLWSIDPQERR